MAKSWFDRVGWGVLLGKQVAESSLECAILDADGLSEAGFWEAVASSSRYLLPLLEP